MQQCRTCHEPVYQTFIQTGMGQSFYYATKQKSAADFNPSHALVFDSMLNFYYKPYWNQDTLYIMEFRIENGDTVHKRLQKINYIVGSGQHTNSHLFSTNGFLYQAPITFYTQKHRWDLAPGFEKGTNSRFQRLIQLECISCHNAYPSFVVTSENKFSEVKLGIDCERCHGPGALHVQQKMAGKMVDTSKQPDYTIVNPRRLSADLQNNICQRCHLQGITVLNDGKSFFDFRPGMQLSEVMNVFMPHYEGSENNMIMASHVERMKKSNCFLKSGKLSCISCHNPHISVKFTPHSQYINACNNCHNAASTKSICTETEIKRKAKNDDCITCHMPRNGSIDIPHVAVTDHYIRKNVLNEMEMQKVGSFLGLYCYNNNNTDNITKARALMEFYERYTPSKLFLDSAIYYLQLAATIEHSAKQNRDLIRAYFLLNDYNQVITLAADLKPEQLNEAWTCYRIGESFVQLKNPTDALKWYLQATRILPYSLNFQNKLGTCYLALNKLPEANHVFHYILQQNPDYTSAYTNLGYISMQQNNPAEAYNYLHKAQELDPDHEQTLMNLAVWFHNKGLPSESKNCLLHLLQKHPQNVQARAMLADLNRG
jgi:hypothetical protein